MSKVTHKGEFIFIEASKKFFSWKYDIEIGA